VSIKDGRDYVYLIWKDSNTRRQFVVGQLSKNGQYEFSYGHEVKEAIENGFTPLLSFEELGKTYTSDILFPAFSSRLPDAHRKDINIILQKYGLKEYYDYELLKKSGARLPIDNLEFIDPIISATSGKIERSFYLAGTRHYVGCNGEDCEKSVKLKMNEKLKLIHDTVNEHDECAISVLTNKNYHIGYIPRYYSKSVLSLLQEGRTYECRVKEINMANNCNECVKVSLEIH